ncbi:hypothetical protein CWB89_18580 [Pseudoalteromonas piscicida]|uniref:Uncharacterized protein n=1 Tax=Pseudoalteromonas piscicida TaxID=43662 RepID=A0AAQ2IRH1_PSEO7|nr:hypothetical protein TW75_19385 [Pseudoalteromonas piscicida]TMN83614.1 hypothetical protein CWB87_06980 [Pseudoalteromonas flavipulchra]TMN35095.1 hypothetical protein CWB94_21360 [Pseudoalteromonas piscicida]TMN36170.1 hypothetical protein CWB95_18005 [Pseudoalteromonas piscicida]TMN47444.1 hypothetical protein CWB92_19945 [Pseudoalteromonas piscicida]
MNIELSFNKFKRKFINKLPFPLEVYNACFVLRKASWGWLSPFNVILRILIALNKVNYFMDEESTMLTLNLAPQILPLRLPNLNSG